MTRWRESLLRWMAVMAMLVIAVGATGCVVRTARPRREGVTVHHHHHDRGRHRGHVRGHAHGHQRGRGNPHR